MNYLSICSGIEAASCAWHELGWKPVGFSEIEPFPCSVLKHRYPTVPNFGDMTKFHEWPELNINLLVGGTPCQAFSVAGLRQGLSDPRGNLTLTFLGLVDRYRPEWVVWENVPGVLSDRTNAFGDLLAGLGQLGYGWAYRMLDAQYFGLAQRRKRVFVVASLGDWTHAASVLFEPESVLGHPPPSRKAGKDIAPTLAARTKGGGGLGTDFDCDGGCIPIQEPGKRTGRSTSDAACGLGVGGVNDPMFTLQAGAVHGVAHVAPCMKGNQGKNSDAAMEAASLVVQDKQWPAEVAPTLNAHFGEKQGLEDQHALGGAGLFVPDISNALTAHNGQRNEVSDMVNGLEAFNANALPDQLPSAGRDTTINDGLTCSQNAAVALRMSVRRLTPTECERLQGFPDHWTLIPGKHKQRKSQDWTETIANLMSLGMDRATAIDLANGPDGPRYKALGNSMAVPCMRWIGRRIAMVSAARSGNWEDSP